MEASLVSTLFISGGRDLSRSRAAPLRDGHSTQAHMLQWNTRETARRERKFSFWNGVIACILTHINRSSWLHPLRRICFKLRTDTYKFLVSLQSQRLVNYALPVAEDGSKSRTVTEQAHCSAASRHQ